jgi:cell division septal protein FtsQ
MIRRRTAIGALSVALLAGLFALSQVAVRRLEFFRVRAVEIAGIRHLDERDIVARLGIPADAHILTPLDPIAARALTLPGIRQASVTRRWPGTIVVTIVEAPAVALVADDGQLLVLDDRGGVLPIEPSRLTTSLPLAERDSSVAALLGRLQATDPQWYQLIDRARANGTEVQLDAEGREVRIQADATTQVLLDLGSVREWLEQHQIPWTAIDARFEGRMFVRKGAA